MVQSSVIIDYINISIIILIDNSYEV